MSKIIQILNRFKYMLNDLIDSSNDGSDTKVLAEARRIHLLNNNIPDPRERERDLDGERDLLRNWSQGHQQRHDTFPSSFSTRHGGGRKVIREEGNKDRGLVMEEGERQQYRERGFLRQVLIII